MSNSITGSSRGLGRALATAVLGRELSARRRDSPRAPPERSLTNPRLSPAALYRASNGEAPPTSVEVRRGIRRQPRRLFCVFAGDHLVGETRNARHAHVEPAPAIEKLEHRDPVREHVGPANV